MFLKDRGHLQWCLGRVCVGWSTFLRGRLDARRVPVACDKGLGLGHCRVQGLCLGFGVQGFGFRFKV